MEEFFNAHQALGWQRASALRLMQQAANVDGDREPGASALRLMQQAANVDGDREPGTGG